MSEPRPLEASPGEAAAAAGETAGAAGLSFRAAPWYLLLVLAATNTINWADRQVVPILFPAIRKDLGLSDTELGIIGGLAFSLVYAVSSFFFGRAADSAIRRNLIAIGLLLWSLATVAGGFATGFITLFAARFFIGVGEASLYPSAMSFIAERFPVDRRGWAMGVFGASAAIGGGLGIGLGGALSEWLGWRAVFFIYGIAGLFLIPAVLSIAEQPRVRERDEGERPLMLLLGFVRDPRLLVVWTSGAVTIAAGVGFAAWIPDYFVSVRGLEVSQAGYLLGLSMLVGGVVGSLLGGSWSDKRRRVRKGGELDVSAVAAAIGVPLVAATLYAPTLPVVLVAGALAPVAVYAYFPALQTILVEIVPPKNHGFAYALHILFLGGVGTGLGPFLVGWISDATGDLRLAMTVLVVQLALGSLLAVIAGRIIRSKE